MIIGIDVDGVLAPIHKKIDEVWKAAGLTCRHEPDVTDFNYSVCVGETAKELAGLEDAHIVRYRRSRTLLEMVFARAGTRRVGSSLDALPALAAPRPMYLWCPQAAAGPQ